jgi:hypothetical protein
VQPVTDQQPIRVTVEIRIDAYGAAAAQGNMTLREDFPMGPASFTELAAIMGQFHDLAETLKAAQAAAAAPPPF